MISSLIYECRNNARIESALNTYQKLIIFLCVIEYLNSNQTLSDFGILKMFENNKLQKPIDKSSTYSYFNSLVLRIFHSDQLIKVVIKTLKDYELNLKENLNLNFKELITDTLKQIRILLTDKRMVRKRKGYCSTNQIYVMNRIVEISKQNNDQFLSNRVNVEEIYDKIPDIESVYEHSFENKRDQLKKIKRDKLNPDFDSMPAAKKNEINEIFTKLYNELIKNEAVRKLQFTHFHYASLNLKKDAKSPTTNLNQSI